MEIFDNFQEDQIDNDIFVTEDFSGMFGMSRPKRFLSKMWLCKEQCAGKPNPAKCQMRCRCMFGNPLNCCKQHCNQYSGWRKKKCKKRCRTGR